MTKPAQHPREDTLYRAEPNRRCILLGQADFFRGIHGKKAFVVD